MSVHSLDGALAWMARRAGMRGRREEGRDAPRLLRVIGGALALALVTVALAIVLHTTGVGVAASNGVLASLAVTAVAVRWREALQARRTRPGTSPEREPGVRGSHGVGSPAPTGRGGVVIVGSGASVSSVITLVRALPVTPGRSLVVVRTDAVDAAVDELRADCVARGIDLMTFTGRPHDGWLPASARGARLVHWAPWLADADLFVLGCDAATAAVRAEAMAYGVPDSRIHALAA